MLRIVGQILVAGLFLVMNVVLLWIILILNRKAGPAVGPLPNAERETTDRGPLSATDILGWEFEYARKTASEAMQDRHTMVNFYLIIFGIIASGVVAVIARDVTLPPVTGALLLWTLCGIGWLYFLKIIRLRQAWHDSAKAMNRIKEFYLQHAAEFDNGVLRTAFRWQADSLPAVDKPWTLYFYSAALVAFLNTIAFVAGGALLNLRTMLFAPLLVGIPLSVLGLVFFGYHIWLYYAFLRPQDTDGSR